jgi:hypothetical protein
MGWFSRKPTPQQQSVALVTVASNLYLHTVPEAADAPASLQFGLSDSKYRYMAFCVSAAAAAVLAYDEKKKIELEELTNWCVQFLVWVATCGDPKFADFQMSPSEASRLAPSYFIGFMKDWSAWPELEKQGRHTEIIQLLCSMIRRTESGTPASEADVKRLGPLALQINCQLPTMQSAFTELTKR